MAPNGVSTSAMIYSASAHRSRCVGKVGGRAEEGIFPNGGTPLTPTTSNRRGWLPLHTRILGHPAHSSYGPAGLEVTSVSFISMFFKQQATFGSSPSILELSKVFLKAESKMKKY